MSPFAFALILFLLGSLWSLINHRRPSDPQKNGRKLPQGPRGLPIIGNLHMLGKLPHRTLGELARKYGPIMSLRLGQAPTFVFSSPEVAELVLKTHDTVFAGRPPVDVVEHMSPGAKGLVFAPYGAYWRNVRKFCTLELLSSSKIDSFAGKRREELSLLVQSLKEAAAARKVVDVSEKVAGLTEDMTYRMLFGRFNKDNSRFNAKAVIQEAVELAGAFNLADYVPFLGALDLQGLTRRAKAIAKGLDTIMESVIQEHEHKDSKKHSKDDKDFLDIMLSLENKSSITHDELSYVIDRPTIKAVMVDMIAGSIDTSRTSIDWVLSEVIRHPRVMNRLKEELRSVIGPNHQMIEERDLSKLKYLDMVIKESFRLHPVGPLLLHESLEDIEINGFYIPKKSRIIINVWALGRDPNVWSDNVEEFFPERFEGSNIDLRGHDFQLIPFGSGRRGCPGMNLGLINVRLVVAQLIHCFDWELPDGMSPSDLDMSENFGLTVTRAKDLLAIPTYCIPS